MINKQVNYFIFAIFTSKSRHVFLMDIISTLSESCLHKNAVDAIVDDILAGNTDIAQLWELTCSDDPRLAWHAVWVLEALCKKDRKQLVPYQRRVVEIITKTKTKTKTETGELRLWLNISLMLLPETKDIDVDLLNFSLENICNMRMAVAMRALCIKIAYQLCKREPELLKELQAVVSMLDLKDEQAAIKSVVKKVIKIIL